MLGGQEHGASTHPRGPPRLYSLRGHWGAPVPRREDPAPLSLPQRVLSPTGVRRPSPRTSEPPAGPAPPLHGQPSAPGGSPVLPGSGGESPQGEVRRALTGESYGRQCPDLPRQRLESHPSAPEHQSWASAPEHRAPEAANDREALESRAGCALRPPPPLVL